jgi:DNA-binding response OmpR family regulator
MKVLVVDDDSVARKVLGAFLKQSCYDVLMMEDGDSAFRALTAPDAPHIAIVDWMMPDLTGTELCAKLRAHPFTIQPYVIIISGRKAKGDIVTALDAGANDFIVKPFNIQETQARLRVAERAINAHLDLHRRITELKLALQQEAVLKKPLVEIIPPPRPVEQTSALLPALEADQIDTVMASALRYCGQSDAPKRIEFGTTRTRPIAWSGLLVLRQQLWIDLLLETNDHNLRTLLRQSAEATTDAEAAGSKFVQRLTTAIRDALMSVFRATNEPVASPLPMQVVRPRFGPCPPLPSDIVVRHHYSVGEATITLTVATHPCPLENKDSEQLQVFDILAEPYPPADTRRAPLLPGKIALSESLVERLRQYTRIALGDVPPLRVHEPSSVALHYSWEAHAHARTTSLQP